jgi:F420-0:gamma-glutamyl ligase
MCSVEFTNEVVCICSRVVNLAAGLRAKIWTMPSTLAFNLRGDSLTRRKRRDAIIQTGTDQRERERKHILLMTNEFQTGRVICPI